MGLKYLAIGCFWVGSIAAAICAEGGPLWTKVGAIGTALGIALLTMFLMSLLLPTEAQEND